MAKYALALLLICLALPAQAMNVTVYRLIAQREGLVVLFYPNEDLTKEECLEKMKPVTARPPAQVLCVGVVVKREFS
jgi:hypothetical protein